MKIVILAGGSGTRLWPVSRTSYPKQFLKLQGALSFLQRTVSRFLQIAKPEELTIVANQSYAYLVKSQLQQIGAHLNFEILVESEAKNTGPAIAQAIHSLHARESSWDEPVLITASDYVISPEERFFDSIALAQQLAQQGKIVTFGVVPSKPETGYGYIQVIREDANPQPYYAVERFVEKPALTTAQAMVEDGGYFWNAGIFCCTIKTFVQEACIHAPELAQIALAKNARESAEAFKAARAISIDHAIMENTSCMAMIPLDLFWSDVGSWDSVFDIHEKDEHCNVTIGNILAIDTRNSLIVGGKRLISTIGLDDVVVIETDDAIFLGKKGESQRVKNLVEELRKRGQKETHDHRTVFRPWGSYTVLEEGDRYKVKRIVVDPQQKLSLQRHCHRSEHWVVVRGTAIVTVGEQATRVHENESIYVPKSTLHRLENPGKVPLELIEVQTGEYLGEDDIERFEDIYGRVAKFLEESSKEEIPQ